MLPKLMLLVMIIAESLAAPTKIVPWNGTQLSPEILEKIEMAQKNGTLLYDFDLLKKLTQAAMFDVSDKEIQMIQSAPFILDKSISEFNSKLMKEVLNIHTGRNVLLSPVSIEFAMLMFFYASPGITTTHQELADTLSVQEVKIKGRSFDPGYLGNIYNLIDYLNKHNTGLEVANAIFLGGGLPVNEDFITFLKVFFGASVKSLHPSPPIAVSEINEYVKENTNGLIENAVGPEAVNTETRALAVNALSHKGKWKIPFKKDDDVEIEFNPFDGQPMNMTAMYLKDDTLRMGEPTGLDAMVLELPYENGDKMYIVLPNQNTPEALKKAVTEFDVEKVRAYLNVQPNGVEVVLPPLKMDYEENVAHYLERLGVKTPFSAHGSQFYNMLKEQLSLDGVFQKTTVTIDHEGTEASAVTVVVKLQRNIGQPKQFVARHPYGFVIVDGKFGLILFSGVVVNPLGQGNPGASP